jgi:hypothetical protein
MKSKQVNAYQWEAIVAKVSHALYEDNLIPDPNAASMRLTTRDSHGPGARRSQSGRRMRAACWHAWRDTLRELFEQYPDVTVRTALATYKGRDGFEDWFQITGAVNIGSIAEPMRMDDACDCKLREAVSA